MTKSLLTAIQTPPTPLLRDLENNSEFIELGGKPVLALHLGDGGFGRAYLYKRGPEYRVAKLYYCPKDRYGDIERRVISFNEIYNKIYGKLFAPLATARVIYGKETFLDMPYISGQDFFYNTINRDRPGKIHALLNYFIENEFFVSDFDQPGNIVAFFDIESDKQYILVRDVDLVGRRASYEEKGEHSVTHMVMHHFVSDGIDINDFTRVVKYQDLESLETKSQSSESQREFEQVKRSFLKLMSDTHPKYLALQAATSFPQLCFIAAQKRKKHIFSKDKGSTKTIDKLLTSINGGKLSALKNQCHLPKKVDKYDLKEVGFYGAMRLQSANVALRKNNLKFIYSIKNNNTEFETKLSMLRNYSLFTFDFTQLVATTSVTTDVGMTPSGFTPLIEAFDKVSKFLKGH